MKSIYTALLLLLHLSLQAQHKPENRILASFGPQYYFNKNMLFHVVPDVPKGIRNC